MGPGIWQDREQLVQDIDYTTKHWEEMGMVGVWLTEQGSGPNQSTGCAHIKLEIMGSQVFL